MQDRELLKGTMTVKLWIVIAFMAGVEHLPGSFSSSLRVQDDSIFEEKNHLDY